LGGFKSPLLKGGLFPPKKGFFGFEEEKWAPLHPHWCVGLTNPLFGGGEGAS